MKSPGNVSGSVTILGTRVTQIELRDTQCAVGRGGGAGARGQLIIIIGAQPN